MEDGLTFYSHFDVCLKELMNGSLIGNLIDCKMIDQICGSIIGLLND